MVWVKSVKGCICCKLLLLRLLLLPWLLLLAILLPLYGTAPASFSKLSLLNKLVGSKAFNKSNCCEVCHFSKEKRLPFPSSSHVSVQPFELVHCDLWGPFSTCTVEGFRYFLTIVNDFSHCTWVYLLKNKSDTQFFIPNFVNMVHNQFHASVKTIRSDNGT